MPARIRLTAIQLPLVEAVLAGKATSLTAIAEALGCDNRMAAQRVFNTVRAGILDAKRDGRSVDYASLRVAKRGKELLAATSTKVTLPSKPNRGAALAEEIHREREASPAQRLLVDASALRRIHTYAAALAEEVSRVLGSPSLASALAGLLGAVPPAAPAPRQRARKAAPSPAPKRARRAAPKVEEEDEVEVEEETTEALYKTVSWAKHGGGQVPEDLAEFTTLAGAKKALKVDKRAHKIVEIATGKVVEQKGRPSLPPDEEE